MNGEFICIKFLSSSFSFQSRIIKISSIIQEYLIIIINSSSCVNTTKVTLILFPSHNDPTSQVSPKNYRLIYLWFLTSSLRLFTSSEYPLPSEINGKLVFFDISPLKGYFGRLKVFYTTINYLAVVLHHFGFRQFLFSYI